MLSILVVTLISTTAFAAVSFVTDEHVDGMIGAYSYKLHYDVGDYGFDGPPDDSYSDVMTHHDFTISDVVPWMYDGWFIGWATSEYSGVAEYYPGDTIRVNSVGDGGDVTVTLYAVWEYAQYNPPVIHADTWYSVVDTEDYYTPYVEESNGHTLTVSDVPEDLNVIAMGEQLRISSHTAGTYQFTATAESLYGSDSTTMTMIVVPKLEFSNDPSSGQLAD